MLLVTAAIADTTASGSVTGHCDPETIAGSRDFLYTSYPPMGEGKSQRLQVKRNGI